MANTYLNTIIERIARVSQEAQNAFGGLSANQLNWKPGEKQWSVGQCLEHLIVSNRTYFPQLKALGDDTRTPTFWERMPLLPGLWGKLLLKSITPEPRQKMASPTAFRPVLSQAPADIVGQFTAHNQELVKHLRNTRGLNHRHTIITSPANRIIVYSLYDAVNILANHEERHLLQAKRVMEMEAFPKN
ncbi:MAG: DinB family protein [Phaeodactylibacter sp.]|nr:DinB family protein [Phaeodactylibacter sp.]MCB9287844.1 DinB family protein [Lewinellaceae bacterium]